MSLRRLPFEIAHWMGLAPALWLLVLEFRGQHRDRAWWLMAAAFAVSVAADLVAERLPAGDRWLVGLAYPATQAMLFGLVFLTRADALVFACALAMAGVAAIAITGARRPDVLVHTVAMLGVAGIVADRWALGPIRVALLVYFSAGWLAWVWYTAAPGWTPWTAYQLARVVGLVLIVDACARPAPALRLAVAA